MPLVQFVRDVMYSEVFWLQDGDEDYVEVEAGTIGEKLEDGSISRDDDCGYYFPSDAFTEANAL